MGQHQPIQAHCHMGMLDEMVGSEDRVLRRMPAGTRPHTHTPAHTRT